ncbi:hypothetical protein [Nocardia sp. NBC_00511]|uniref:hypothetical protein n=1 Tax=Nocardia sp. NBC_00511 TaxID=2903591 RepID=UPI002F912ADE
MPPRHNHGRRLVELFDEDGDRIMLTRDPDGYLRLVLRDSDQCDWETYVRFDELTAGFLEHALRRERLTRHPTI